MELLAGYEIREYKYVNKYEFEGHCKEMINEGWFNMSYTIPQHDSLTEEVTAKYSRGIVENS